MPHVTGSVAHAAGGRPWTPPCGLQQERDEAAAAGAPGGLTSPQLIVRCAEHTTRRHSGVKDAFASLAGPPIDAACEACRPSRRTLGTAIMANVAMVVSTAAP